MQPRNGRQTTNLEAVNKIEKLFYAVESKLNKSSYSGIVEDSLKSQIFGVFSETYREW